MWTFNVNQFEKLKDELKREGIIESDDSINKEKFFSLINKDVKCIDKSEIDDSGSTNFYHIFRYDDMNNDGEINEIFQDQNIERVKNNVKSTEDSGVCLVCIKDNPCSLVKDNEEKIKKQYHQKIKEKIADFKKSDIKFVDIFISQLEKPKILSIEVKNRIKCLENKLELNEKNDENKILVTSYVFTVKINKLLEMYKLKGDVLFSKNVRIGGIRDNINVTHSIQKTYSEKPEEFWFFNNGISMVIQEDKIKMQRLDTIEVTLDETDTVSIVNGAQTIKALSELKDNKENDSEVILRIYVYDKCEKKEDQEKISKFLETVTLSLNRQKPITPADLAYTTPFVKYINEANYHFRDVKEVKDYLFTIIKTGQQESLNLNEFSLNNFAKVTKAYLGRKPLEARSSSYNKLLKTKGVDFEDQEIFIPFKDNEDSEDNEGIKKWFLQYYKPVNFAMNLYKFLSKLSLEDKYKEIESVLEEKKDDNDLKENVKAFLKYGDLLVVFLIVNMNTLPLNSSEKKDYTNWEPIIKHNEEEKKDFEKKFLEIYKKIVSIIVKKAEEESKSQDDSKLWDSNTFKNDKNFTEYIFTELTELKKHLTSEEN